MPRPRKHLNAKVVIGSGLKTLETAFFDQIIPQLTEAKPGVVVTKACPGHSGKPFKMWAQTVAVAVLKTEIDGSADDQRVQREIREECCRPQLGEHIEGR